MQGTGEPGVADAAVDIFSSADGVVGGMAGFDPDGSRGSLASAGNDDVFVAELSASGDFLWARGMGGRGYACGNGIAAS
jgi:hypothetical protein